MERVVVSGFHVKLPPLVAQPDRETYTSIDTPALLPLVATVTVYT
jgi:hypothetical protein